MATYVIGDIQGCYASFLSLLDKIKFDASRDRLWLVGDLINRGHGSLEVLRWVYQHRALVVTILGNHDLHALAIAEGVTQSRRGDTLQRLLAAPDCEELLGWLRHQAIIHAEDGYLMVHAGLLPQWTAKKAKDLAAEVEAALRNPDYRDFLTKMYGNQPDQWNKKLAGMERLRVITNAMTRMRICTVHGQMEFKFKGEPADIPQGYLPWFDVPGRKSADTTVICGHWSALDLLLRDDLYALDSGCLWGGKLTALRLQDRRVFQVSCAPEDSAPLQ